MRAGSGVTRLQPGWGFDSPPASVILAQWRNGSASPCHGGGCGFESRLGRSAVRDLSGRCVVDVPGLDRATDARVWALRILRNDFPGMYASLERDGLAFWDDELGCYLITDKGRAFLSI